MKIVHYYRRVDTPHSLLPSIKEQLLSSSSSSSLSSSADDRRCDVLSIETEYCFNVQIDTHPLDGISQSRLEWLLRETFDVDGLRLEHSAFDDDVDVIGGSGGDSATAVYEFGPRMTFTSAFSSNATSICAACGLSSISRLERSRRYRVRYDTSSSSSSSSSHTHTHTHPPSASISSIVKGMLHDRMTEEEYPVPITTFESGNVVVPVMRVPIMERGRDALVSINDERGLGFDDFDLDFYTELFRVRLTGGPCLCACACVCVCGLSGGGMVGEMHGCIGKADGRRG